ncbi:helix-turn-helix domain-containing protein [Corynebacterium breve]|uniref:Helix-turn-helix domain-containing protein n=1 Tax=Corynebacterium breve TaxID=3049799 RepID=A0ABY8VCI3_9CORY|nr:helix-turn-helix domain-containing protein [Corynebacterium breve]WIM67380.1 helix-turn-helix domain-containing protein [Corynebacterium breve]
MSAATLTANGLVINERTVEKARETQIPQSATLSIKNIEGQEVAVPEEVQEMLLKTLESIAQKGEITISRMPEELTSTTAADFLGVSRPTLMKWAKEGRIESHKVKTHTRFNRDDVLELKKQRANERRRAVAELREFNAEHEDLFDD